LVNIIGEFSKEKIDKQQLEDKVEKLDMWDISYFYPYKKYAYGFYTVYMYL
jgi:hypothetical protein